MLALVNNSPQPVRPVSMLFKISPISVVSKLYIYYTMVAPSKANVSSCVPAYAEK